MRLFQTILTPSILSCSSKKERMKKSRNKKLNLYQSFRLLATVDVEKLQLQFKGIRNRREQERIE